MIPVIPHTLSLEHSWKSVRLWNLLLGDHVVGAFRLSNNELADLSFLVSNHSSQIKHRLRKLTCNSVSVMVLRLTRA